MQNALKAKIHNLKSGRAVLLLAYGGPDSLEDIEPYLRNIRGGRPIPPPLVVEYRRRYALIGGKSPLLEITCRQAAALAEALSADLGFDGPVTVGMRHWQPTIEEAVRELAEQGVVHIIALCMTPHYSGMSIGAYRQKLEEAVAVTGLPMKVDFIESWHDHPRFIAALARSAREGLTCFAPEENPYVLFTAHSLPVRIKETDDPYAEQVRETAELVASALELAEDRWEFCFQSAGKRGGPWLGPLIEDRLVSLAEAGERALLVVPIGFVAENIELLYDIDIQCQELVKPYGVHLERAPMMNDRPDFIATLATLLADIVRMNESANERISEL